MMPHWSPSPGAPQGSGFYLQGGMLSYFLVKWYAELVPVEGRCFGYSFSSIWQGSGRILDTVSDSSAKDLQVVGEFNTQDSGHSDCVRGLSLLVTLVLAERKEKSY